MISWGVTGGHDPLHVHTWLVPQTRCLPESSRKPDIRVLVWLPCNHSGHSHGVKLLGTARAEPGRHWREWRSTLGTSFTNGVFRGPAPWQTTAGGPPGLVSSGKTRQGSPGPKMSGGIIRLVNPPSQVTLPRLTLGFLVLGLFLSWLEMGFIKLSPVNIPVQ